VLGRGHHGELGTFVFRKVRRDVFAKIADDIRLDSANERIRAVWRTKGTVHAGIVPARQWCEVGVCFANQGDGALLKGVAVQRTFQPLDDSSE
jgi:hypothetical protein